MFFLPVELIVNRIHYLIIILICQTLSVTVFPEISIISNRRCIIADAISKVFNRR